MSHKSQKQTRNKKRTPLSTRKAPSNNLYNANRKASYNRNKNSIQQAQFDDLWTQIGIKNSLLHEKTEENGQLREKLAKLEEKFALNEQMDVDDSIEFEESKENYIDINIKMSKETFEKKQMM
eukprot:105440_1